MEAMTKKLNRSAFRNVVSVSLVNQALDQLSKKAANRSAPLVGKNFSFVKCRFTQDDRDILLMGIS
jgi:hypothetical protein